jgi:uncharacterized membrane protein
MHSYPFDATQARVVVLTPHADCFQRIDIQILSRTNILSFMFVCSHLRTRKYRTRVLYISKLGLIFCQVANIIIIVIVKDQVQDFQNEDRHCGFWLEMSKSVIIHVVCVFGVYVFSNFVFLSFRE